MKSWRYSFIFVFSLVVCFGTNSESCAMDSNNGGGIPVPALVRVLQTLTRTLGVPTVTKMLQSIEDAALYDLKYFSVASMSSFLGLMALLDKYFPEALYKKCKGEKLLAVKRFKALIAVLPTLYLILKASYAKGRKMLAHWKTPAQKDNIPTDLERLALRAFNNGQGTLVDLENTLRENLFIVNLNGIECIHGAQWPLSKCTEPLFECVYQVARIFQNVTYAEIQNVLMRTFRQAIQKSQSSMAAVQSDIGTALEYAFIVTSALYENLGKSVNFSSFKVGAFRFAAASRVGYDNSNPCTVFTFVKSCLEHYKGQDAADVTLWWRHFCRITLLTKILDGTSEADICAQDFQPQTRYGNASQIDKAVATVNGMPVIASTAIHQQQQSSSTLLPVAHHSAQQSHQQFPQYQQQQQQMYNQYQSQQQPYSYFQQQGMPTVTLTDGNGEFMTVSMNLVQRMMLQGGQQTHASQFSQNNFYVPQQHHQQEGVSLPGSSHRQAIAPQPEEQRSRWNSITRFIPGFGGNANDGNGNSNEK